MCGAENQRKHDAPSTSVMKNKSPYPHFHHQVKRENNGVNDQKKEKKRKRSTAMELEVKSNLENESDDDVEILDHASFLKEGISGSFVQSEKSDKIKFSNFEADKGLIANKNIAENNLEKESDDEVEILDRAAFLKESDNEVEILDRAAFLKEGISGSFVPSEKSNKSKFTNDKAAKGLMANKNIDANNLEKESDDEVEILDVAAFLKEESFVPSKKFDKTIEEDFQIIGSTSVQNDFREKVLDVIGKPFDKEKYNRLQEAVHSGNYLDHHPASIYF